MIKIWPFIPHRYSKKRDEICDKIEMLFLQLEMACSDLEKIDIHIAYHRKMISDKQQKPELTERMIESLRLRDSGMTYNEIGKQMGFTASRARELCMKAKSRMTE